MGTYETNQTIILWNNGNATWDAEPIVKKNKDIRTVHLEDLNNDGKKEILFSVDETLFVSYQKNNSWELLTLDEFNSNDFIYSLGGLVQNNISYVFIVKGPQYYPSTAEVYMYVFEKNSLSIKSKVKIGDVSAWDNIDGIASVSRNDIIYVIIAEGSGCTLFTSASQSGTNLPNNISNNLSFFGVQNISIFALIISFSISIISLFFIYLASLFSPTEASKKQTISKHVHKFFLKLNGTILVFINLYFLLSNDLLIEPQDYDYITLYVAWVLICLHFFAVGIGFTLMTLSYDSKLKKVVPFLVPTLFGFYALYISGTQFFTILSNLFYIYTPLYTPFFYGPPLFAFIFYFSASLLASKRDSTTSLWLVYTLFLTGIIIGIYIYRTLSYYLFLFLFHSIIESVSHIFYLMLFGLLIVPILTMIPGPDEPLTNITPRKRISILIGSFSILVGYAYQVIMFRSVLPNPMLHPQSDLYLGMDFGFSILHSIVLIYPVIGSIGFLLLLLNKDVFLLIAKNILYLFYILLPLMIFIDLFTFLSIIGRYGVNSLYGLFVMIDVFSFGVFVFMYILSRDLISHLRGKSIGEEKERAEALEQVEEVKTEQQIREEKYEKILQDFKQKYYGYVTTQILTEVNKNERKAFSVWLADKLIVEGKHELAKDILIKVGEYKKAIPIIVSLAVYYKTQGKTEKAKKLYKLTADLYKKLGDTQKAKEIEKEMNKL